MSLSFSLLFLLRILLTANAVTPPVEVTPAVTKASVVYIGDTLLASSPSLKIHDNHA
jgi:hypothetical protein